MSIATSTPTQSAPPPAGAAADPAAGATACFAWAAHDLYRMTVTEYERIGGMLDDDRVELIDGYLVRKMRKNPPHIWSVKTILKFLAGLLPAGWTWRKEDPVRIPEFDEPEPDLAIVRGPDDDYKVRIPGPQDVALLIESSETALERDRGPKLSAYAKAGIPIYWIVNLVDNQVELYSQSGPDGYQSRQDFKPGQHVPVVIDGVEVGRIAVVDILP